MIEVVIISILPMASISVGLIVVLVFGLFFEKVSTIVLSTITCLIGVFFSYGQQSFSETTFGSMLYVDTFSYIFNLIIIGGTAAALYLNHGQLKAQRVNPSVDIDVLILLASVGAMAMVSSAHLIVLFVAFELLSIAVYVLTGIARREKASAEAALKYFILGAFSSAFLLYGMALIYGATGSMTLEGIASVSESSSNPMLLLGLGLVLFGFGFKVSLAPFHFWAPDVYQGAPVSITTYMAVVVKAAAFGALLRLLVVAFGSMSEVWVGLVWLMAVLSMTVGNVLALRQKSIKRMLAYSSIAHAGYAAIGLVTVSGSSPEGIAALIFYMLVYAFMTVASFGIVLLVSAGTEQQYDRDSFDSLRGFGWRKPALGIAMTIAILSLAGIPPLAGFIGKVYLFGAAIDRGFIGLTIIAAINSVISLYYYLRVLVVMYFESREAPELEVADVECSRGPIIAVTFATVCILYLGLFSQQWYELALKAAEGLFSA